MKKISAHSKTSLFLIEMIFVLLFLSISSAACIRVFALAETNHRKAEEIRQIEILTTSVGEILEGSNKGSELSQIENDYLSMIPGGTVEHDSIIWYFDSSWKTCTPSKAVYEMKLELNISSFLKKGNLSFCTISDHKGLYNIKLAFPVTADKEASS